MTGPAIHIHAGAHRTGTSSFQYFLSANAEAIRAAGHDVVYPARDGIPGGRLRLRLPGPGTGDKRKAELQQFLTEEFTVYSTAPDRPLILSEENIPGRMIHFYGGGFFPQIRPRLKFLRGLLPGPVARLVYVVRPYDELFVSAYRKRSEDNPVQDFDQVRANIAKVNRGWPHVISALRDVLAPGALVVVPYAARGSDAELFRRLVPDLAGMQITEPEVTLNVSATDAALIALQKRYRAGEVLERPDWQAVIAEHAEDREDRGYAAFPEAEVAHQRTRYAEDLDRLRDMEGIEFVEP